MYNLRGKTIDWNFVCTVDLFHHQIQAECYSLRTTIRPGDFPIGDDPFRMHWPVVSTIFVMMSALCLDGKNERIQMRTTQIDKLVKMFLI